MSCSIEGCDRKAKARGWCGSHYNQWRTTGSPLRTTVLDRFWRKVDVAGPDECWLWTAYTDHWDYGTFRDGAAKKFAHRFAYEVLVGPIPEGLHLDHLCRVRHCVNPAHLEPVTPAENNRRAHLGRRKRPALAPSRSVGE